FIPRPVTIGFTAGIAVIIFTGQIGNFLGLRDLEKHEYFLSNMNEVWQHIGTINVYSIITAVVSLVIMLLTPRFMPKIPGPLVGLILSTVIAVLLFQGKVDTIGSVYGAIPNQLPTFQFPELSIATIEELLIPAFIIAMLGGIESLL